MAFIKLHDEYNNEVIVNTDNVTFINRSRVYFIDGYTTHIGISETLDEVEEIIKKAEQEKYSGGKL